MSADILAPSGVRPSSGTELTTHYGDVIMGAIASQTIRLAIVYSTVYSDANQRKHQSSAFLAFVRGIHRDRWIIRTNDQLRGKCFHLMTSSWTIGKIFQIYLAYNDLWRVFASYSTGKLRCVILPTLRSLSASEVVIMTTSDSVNDDEVGIMTTLGYQCLHSKWSTRSREIR